jgi:hypothetical protein
MREHSREGFEFVDMIGPQDGHLTRSWETGLRKYIAGVRDFSRKIESKGTRAVGSRKSIRGSLETWFVDELKVDSLVELLEIAKIYLVRPV